MNDVRITVSSLYGDDEVDLATYGLGGTDEFMFSVGDEVVLVWDMRDWNKEWTASTPPDFAIEVNGDHVVYDGLIFSAESMIEVVFFMVVVIELGY